MGNWFNRSVKVPNIRHSMFDMSNNYKTSFDFGQLIPNYWEDCVPSDKFKKLKADNFLRLAPMTFPIMHRVKVRQHFFNVPYRLILGDEGYEMFLNNQANLPGLAIYNDTASDYSLKNHLTDYLGFFFKEDTNVADLTITSGSSVLIPNPVPFFAYLLIWKTWFADEVLDSQTIAHVESHLLAYKTAVTSGTTAYTISLSTDAADFLIKAVSYTKDYFTSAQTDTQRGVVVPLISNSNLYGGDSSPRLMAINSSTGLSDTKVNPDFDGINSVNSQIYGSLRVTSSETILDLWKKEQVQRFLQVDNVFGTRVFEKLAGHWGVISSDARLQKPQFISGSQSIIQISEVLQTSETSTNPLGSFAGRGTSFMNGRSCKVFIEEHSIVMGLISVIPDNGYNTYTQRAFFKKNIYDFATPEFNNIGYQPIFKGEIFNLLNSSGVIQDPYADFAYQPRYSEYRSHPSIATGDFRTSTLKAWHLNRDFSTIPPFNENFVHVNRVDSDRIFADTTPTNPHFYLDSYVDSLMSRPVSYMPSSLNL